MNHKVGFNKLGLKTSHRKALHRNMAISLFRYERVTTTKAKALAVRRTVEKMITRAKVDSVHNRRIVGRDIKDKEILAKLFNEIAPRYVGRPGGYTRVLKLGWRQGDAAETVLLELVNEDSPAKTGKKKKTSKNSKPVAKESSEAVEAKVDTKKEAEEVKTDATEKDVVNQEAGDSSKPDVEEASSLEKDE